VIGEEDGAVEKLLVAALAVVGLGLMVIAGAIGSVVLRGWAASRADETRAAVSEVARSLDKLESKLKLLQGEWSDYHTKLDSIVRRGVRLGVLERKENEPEQPAEVPLSRSEILRRYRERQKGAR
jgi:hypothetical protein